MEPWLIGMQLALLGCFSSAIGLILLKHSTAVESSLPLHRQLYSGPDDHPGHVFYLLVCRATANDR